MRMLLHVFKIWLRILRADRYIASKCGHKTARIGWLQSRGIYKDHILPINEEGSVDYCHRCLSKMSISCGCCGDPILIGDPITTFLIEGEVWEVPHKDATIFLTDPYPLLIGCYSPQCIAMMEVFFTGYWTAGEEGQGVIQKIVTADEERPRHRSKDLPEVKVVDSLDKVIEEIEKGNDEMLSKLSSPSERIH